ncbi:hypothetical protein [Pedococcus dokdonensis]|nr:hypothetical protein [Pedococcus dokdonensis]
MASIILLLVFVGAVLSTRSGRGAAISILRLAWSRLGLSFVAFAAYLVGVVAIADRIGAWNDRMTGETIAWFVLSGVAAFGQFTKVGRDRWFLRNFLRRLFELGAVVTVLMTAVDFSLVVEIALGLVVTVLVLLQTVAEMSDDLRPVRRPLATLLGVFAAGVGVAVVWQLVSQFSHLDLAQIFRSLAMAIWLPVSTLPALILMAAVSEYEQVFIRLSFMHGVSNLWLSRAALIRGLGARPQLIAGFSHPWRWEIRQAETWASARRVVGEYRTSQTRSLESLTVERSETLAKIVHAGAGYYDATGRSDPRFAEMLLLVRSRPTCWEYLLFALALSHFVEMTRRWVALHERSPEALVGRTHSRKAALGLIDSYPQRALAIVEGVDGVFSEAQQTEAFGPPGQPGDPVRIIQLARDTALLHAKLVDLSLDSRAVTMDKDLAGVRDALRALSDEPAAQIEAFARTGEKRTRALPGRLRKGRRIEMTLRLTLSISSQATRRLRRAIREATAG